MFLLVDARRVRQWQTLSWREPFFSTFAAYEHEPRELTQDLLTECNGGVLAAEKGGSVSPVLCLEDTGDFIFLFCSGNVLFLCLSLSILLSHSLSDSLAFPLLLLFLCLSTSLPSSRSLSPARLLFSFS